jgi:uncharacterized protein
VQLLLGNNLLQTINIDLVIAIILVLFGFVVGFVGGMVGLVLGVLRLAFIILGVEPSFSHSSSSSSSSSSISVAAGTNIGVSTFGAIAAAIRHFRQKNISLQTFLIMAATGSTGGFFGSVFTKYIPVTLLLGLIAIIVLYEAFVLIKSSRKKKDEEMRRSNNNEEDNNNLDLIHGPSSALRSSPSNPSNISGVRNKQFIFTESLIGFGIGFVGGLVGLIIGSIRLPAMISVLKMETKVAIGTNLAVSSLTGVSSLVGHLINGNVDFLIMITMGPAAMLGGYMGAKYTNRFSEGSLKLIIGIVLIVVTGFIIWRIFYAIG